MMNGLGGGGDDDDDAPYGKTCLYVCIMAHTISAMTNTRALDARDSHGSVLPPASLICNVCSIVTAAAACVSLHHPASSSKGAGRCDIIRIQRTIDPRRAQSTWLAWGFVHMSKVIRLGQLERAASPRVVAARRVPSG